MKFDEFLPHFADCFNTTPAAAIERNTRFKQLEEWGSMMALIVIAMVDSQYSKILTSEDLQHSETVMDLFELLQNK